MANSPLVSIRIPPETLARIDRLAQKFYPPRRVGKAPNRSQIILDAIHQFLDQHESTRLDHQLDDQVDHQQAQDDRSVALVEYEQDHTQNLYPESLPKYPAQINPSTREFVDWWFNYFSYMKKISDTWFKPK